MGDLLKSIKNSISSLVDVSSGGSVGVDPTSYVSIIQDLRRFRGGSLGDGQMYDMPGHVYFRILFHFYNNSDAGVIQPGVEGAACSDSRYDAFTGLIAPAWQGLTEAQQEDLSSLTINKNNLEDFWSSTNAFNYLMLNNEIGRAKNLKSFVEILSNVNSQSPWYFQSIKGLETAIERSVVNADFTFKEERDKITIECLDDSYDQRIGTMLDLYRSVVWSWETKRAILPSNLRKFDMTVILFQLPLRGAHVSRKSLSMTTAEHRSSSKDSEGSLSILAGPGGLTVFNASDSTSAPVASYKAFEFHGCEIDYNSSKSGQSEISNAEGAGQKYNIDIFYDDMYEIRYNEFLNGGSYASDLMGDNRPVIMDSSSTGYTDDSSELPEVTAATYQDPSTSILDQVIGYGKSKLSTAVNKIYLGNLNGLSVSKLESQVNSALSGNLFSTIGAIKQYTGSSKPGQKSLSGNIYQKGNADDTARIIKLGNIFKSNSVINS